jgi:hypothetical protein
MKIFKIVYYSVLFSFLLLFSCNNTNENKIKVNTISFTANGVSYNLPATGQIVFLNNQYIGLNVRSVDKETAMLLSWTRTNQDRVVIGRYEVGGSMLTTQDNGVFTTYLACNPSQNFSFTVEKHDTQTKTFSGTFGGKLCLNRSGAAVEIKNGRFLVSY